MGDEDDSHPQPTEGSDSVRELPPGQLVALSEPSVTEVFPPVGGADIVNEVLVQVVDGVDDDGLPLVLSLVLLELRDDAPKVSPGVDLHVGRLHSCGSWLRREEQGHRPLVHEGSLPNFRWPVDHPDVGRDGPVWLVSLCRDKSHYATPSLSS